MTDLHSDGELMDQVRDASAPEAFRQLVARWRPRLAGYFRPLLAQPALVDDAVQEVLVTLWTHRQDWRSHGRVSAWVFALAKHHWLNLRRREARRATVDLAEAPDLAAAERPDQAVLARDQAARVREAVAALPDSQRTVFELAVGDGLAERLIAERLCIPVGTVKSRLHTARQRVRAALEDDHA